MSKTFETIDGKVSDWIARQHMFFVGSAPLGADGHVNVSPKGRMETFRVLSPTSVAYLDFAGSGAETIAHLRENGRIVVMFCAFEGPPRIVRLHGRGYVVQADDVEWDELVERCGFVELQSEGAARSIVRVEVSRVSDSCGYVVPQLAYVGQRDQHQAWVENRVRTKGASAIADYVAEKNERSIDGLPAIDTGRLLDAAAPSSTPS